MKTKIKYKKAEIVLIPQEIEVDLPHYFKTYDGVGMIAEDLTCKRITTNSNDFQEERNISTWTISVNEWEDSFHHFLNPKSQITRREFNAVLSRFWMTAQCLSVIG